MPQRREQTPPGEHRGDTEGQVRAGGARRLIAGLRVSREDEELLALVAPFLPEAASAGELAYRLWRRGLELSLAELVGVGVRLPLWVSEEYLATLVAQRVILCLPLLRRTGKLALLGLEVPDASTALELRPPATKSTSVPEIDPAASATIEGMGGAEFL